MGSNSDLVTMKEAINTLRKFGLNFDVNIISAHRSPEKVQSYAKGAEKKYEAIIAGAGGAAHLAGVIASLTPIPVIGVPMLTAGLGGLDSLLSMVQMPSGVPVATVAVGGAKNAGILAIQILGTSDDNVLNKLILYKKSLAEESKRKNENPAFTK